MKHSITRCLVIILCITHLNTHAQGEYPSFLSESYSKSSSLLYSNEPLFEVEYKGNLPHGNFRSFHLTATKHDAGTFRSGIPDGEWKGWYSNGQLKFIRHYSADKFIRIKQEIKKDQRQIFTPLALAAKQDRQIFKAATNGNNSFADLYGKRNEEELNQLSEAELADRVKFNSMMGDLSYLAPFDDCLHHGLYMNFYPDGTAKDSGYYKNGLREGYWIEWLQSKQLRSAGAYTHGKKTGTWSYYDGDGKLKALLTYSRKGRLLNKKLYS